MEHKDLIQSVEREVKSLFEGEGTGHDWFHIDRVRRNAVFIAREENADIEIVELGALLHDIADHKFHNNDLTVGPDRARDILLNQNAGDKLANQISQIVAEVSYKGAGVKTPVTTLEAAVVQDADRLDALGAIGIARAFAYGGSKHRELYNPDKKPNLHESFLAYAKDEGTTVNHFYEKLFLLKDRMQTKTGKSMAEKRHNLMEKFIESFLEEWNLNT